MMATAYDPAARRARYLEQRELKGRAKGVAYKPRPTTAPKKASKTDDRAKARARVTRLKGKVDKLQGALTKTLTDLAEMRRTADKTERENSDGKTTASERQSSKEYRDKNQAKIAAKRKSETASSGSTSTTKASPESSEVTVESLENRVAKIRTTLKSAKAQLSAAQSASGQLSHSSTEEVVLMLNLPISRKESVKMTADFGGYATRHDTPCADGRTILPGAFKENHEQIVPLVFQHGHSDINNVLGHVVLEHRDEGVYAHGYFNETTQGQNAKIQVQHGDLKFLSIFANQLKERATAGIAHAKDVMKGNIREVSLVLAGANPGAFIDNITFAHSDGVIETDHAEAIITSGLELELAHADTDDDDDDETLQDILHSLSDKQTTAVNYLLSQALLAKEDATVKHDDLDEDDEDSEAGTVGDDDTDTDEDADDNVQHNNQEDNSMTHNVFDQAGRSAAIRQQVTLSHDDLQSIVKDAKKQGSLKEAVENFIAHTGINVGGTLQHGIENIEYLFPDAQLLENSPAFITRRMEWVDTVLKGVRKSPFSRIKTITADITPDEARARGYIKGNMKNEEFFALSKRETNPQTVYKKQKLDRDDVIDIVNLDVVAWLKAEMKVMLDEEIAGAILVGDGRSIGDEDKIKETRSSRTVATTRARAGRCSAPRRAPSRRSSRSRTTSVVVSTATSPRSLLFSACRRSCPSRSWSASRTWSASWSTSRTTPSVRTVAARPPCSMTSTSTTTSSAT